MELHLRGRTRLSIGEWEVARRMDCPSNIWIDLGHRPAPPKKRNHPIYIGERYDDECDVYWLPDRTSAPTIPAL